MHVYTFLLTLPLAGAYPWNMVNQGKRFAYSKNDNLGMSIASPGTYDPDLIQQSQVSCNNRGLYMIGQDLSTSELTSHDSLDGEARYTKYDANTVGTITISGACFDVICANNREWSYASTCNGQIFDTFAIEDGSDTLPEEKDVVVIGCGIGGLSAARAMFRRGTPAAEIKIICKAPGYSTTDMSTGVMFFPDNQTYDEAYLDTRVPESQKQGLNKPLMLDWFNRAKESLEFWEDDLELQDWPAAPTDYQDMAGPTLKVSCDMGECGNNLTRRLKAGLDVQTGTVTRVARAPDGRFRIFYTNGTEQILISTLLVVAAGGNGLSLYPNSTHAVGNNALALKIADDLNLRKVGQQSCYWLPHYNWNNQGPQEEWFSLFNCEPDCGASGCDSYNVRGLAMQDDVCGAQAFNTSECGQQFHFWRTLVGYSLQAVNMSIPLQEGCGNLEYLKGVIDCKGGFEIGLDGASSQLDRLYASGVSAHAFTADTYISPGATIGLAAYNGWKVGLEASTRIQAYQIRRQRRIERSYNMVPTLFAVASWLLLLAVIFHVISSAGGQQQTLYAYMHYFFAGIAVFLFTLAVATAASSATVPKEHSRVGYLTFILLWLQVLGGSWLAWQWHSAGKGYSAAGLAHRVSGILILALVSWQYFSAGQPDGAVALLNAENDHDAYFDGAIVWTAFLGLVLIASFYLYHDTLQKLVGEKPSENMMRSFL